MKGIIRLFFFTIVSLWFTSQIFPALEIRGSWQNITASGFVFTILMLLVKPLLKILFIPINIITFGLASFLVDTITLFLLTQLVSSVQVHPWTYPGFSNGGFSVPPFHFTYIPALIVSSIVFTSISHLLFSITES